MITVAVKLGVITQAELDGQDGQNVSDAFVERVRKGMDALTVRGEMDKKPRNRRSFVTLLLTTCWLPPTNTTMAPPKC